MRFTTYFSKYNIIYIDYLNINNETRILNNYAHVTM